MEKRKPGPKIERQPKTPLSPDEWAECVGDRKLKKMLELKALLSWIRETQDTSQEKLEIGSLAEQFGRRFGWSKSRVEGLLKRGIGTSAVWGTGRSGERVYYWNPEGMRNLDIQIGEWRESIQGEGPQHDKVEDTEPPEELLK